MSQEWNIRSRGHVCSICGKGLVDKAAHSDKFVAAMRALGRSVEYAEVPDRGHCDLGEDALRRYEAFVRDAVRRP